MSLEETLRRPCAVCLEVTPFPVGHAAVESDGVTYPTIYCEECAKLSNGTTAEFYRLLCKSLGNVSKLLEEPGAAH